MDVLIPLFVFFGVVGLIGAAVQNLSGRGNAHVDEGWAELKRQVEREAGR